MNTLDDLIKRHNELALEIAILRAREQPWPKPGDTFWSVKASLGCVELTYDGGTSETALQKANNFFKTKEEADRENDYRRVVAELERCPGRKPFVKGEMSWYIQITCDDCSSNYAYETFNGFANLYFESDAAVRKAIDTVGAERIHQAAYWIATDKPVRDFGNV